MTSNNNHRPLEVHLPIRVKTYDIDFVGHVNNIVYIRWLEDLRIHLLDEHYPLEVLREHQLAPIVVQTQIHYRQPIDLSDRDVDARMWIPKLGMATFHLQAEFSVNGDLRCTATQRGTFIDTTTMKPLRIPAHLLEKFQQTEGS